MPEHKSKVSACVPLCQEKHPFVKYYKTDGCFFIHIIREKYLRGATARTRWQKNFNRFNPPQHLQ